MSTLLRLADLFRATLIPFIIGAIVLFSMMVVTLAVQRLVREALFRRRRRLEMQYQPAVDAAIMTGDADAYRMLTRMPARHRAMAGRLLLTLVRSLSGPPVARAHTLAEALALTEGWRRDVRHGHWWRRADAAHAIGLIHDEHALDALVALLDDPHEEVRAAAVGALGNVGDMRAIPALLQRLPEQSRHQRVRIVEALRGFGSAASDEILQFTRQHLEILPEVVEIVTSTCGVRAMDDLLVWCHDDRPKIRTAALRAIGTIGVDDRSFYYALRALGDESADARAMAARALGRSGREEAAIYLGARLDDEWVVAASAAQALIRLSAAGRSELTRAATGAGQGATLAKQMLWTSSMRAAS